MIEAILRDLRFAARSLRRSPGFTAASVTTLALGIGATTAVFSVVYGVLFRPLPFPNADRLVQIVQLVPGRGGAAPSRSGLTTGQVAEWRATSRTLTAIGHYMPSAGVLTDVPTPVRMNGASVSVSLFRALGVAPMEGRLFHDDEELAGNTDVVILSHSVWNARFGGEKDRLEKVIILNGRPHRVIGVMPPGFGFPAFASAYMSLNSAGVLDDAPEFWVPRAAAARPPGPEKGGTTLRSTLALLAPGVTVEQARAEANTLMQAHVRERWTVEVVSARVEQGRQARTVLLLFQTAVVLVFMIACINVVNLLLARAGSRRHDLSVRLSLGATRADVARYAIAEGLIIGISGGMFGTMIATLVVMLVRALPPYVLPRLAEIRVDPIVLAFAAGSSLLAGLLVGAISAVRVLRADAGGGNLAWHRRGTTTQRQPRALIILETAASVVVLTAAALLLTSFVKLTNVDRGFDPQGIFSFRISLPPSYKDFAAQRGFHDAFADRLRQLPGVTSVAASAGMVGQSNVGFALAIDGQRVANAAIGFQQISPGVFETLRIPLRGRDFTRADRRARAGTAIVNETFARRFFPARDPIGQQIDFQDWKGLEIIAVVGDTRTRELDREVAALIYLPEELTTWGFPPETYLIRSSETVALGETIRTVARAAESNAVVYDAAPLTESLARMVTTPKVYSATTAGFAIVAVALAALGLFGVLSYSVRIRTPEFGIRIALGAPSRAVVTSVMREALGAVAVGLAVGLLGAVYFSRFLAALLFGVTPGDPLTLAAVAVLFVAVAGIATYIPARRATRVDPLVALRTE